MVLFNQVSQSEQKLASFLWGRFFPWSFKCFTRCRYGNIDIFFSSLMNKGDHFFSSRVDDLDSLAVNAFDELIVDKSEWLGPVRRYFAR